MRYFRITVSFELFMIILSLDCNWSSAYFSWCLNTCSQAEHYLAVFIPIPRSSYLIWLHPIALLSIVVGGSWAPRYGWSGVQWALKRAPDRIQIAGRTGIQWALKRAPGRIQIAERSRIQWALKRAPDRIQIAGQRAPSWLNLNEGLTADTHSSFKIRGSCE